MASFCAVVLLLWSCSTTKHVPDGQYLLDKVEITVDGNRDVTSGELYNFLRQTPNHKVLGLAPLQLSVYSLSGNDSTKWYNTWLQKVGRPPVIYDENLTDASRRQLRQALINRGYMGAAVTVDTVFLPEKKRARVTYHISTGEPHVISSLTYDIADSVMHQIIVSDSSLVEINIGDLFDRNALDNVRTKVTQRLREEGYYSFNREHISFTADTIRGSKSIGLTLNIKDLTERDSLSLAHRVYVINSVRFVTDDATRTEHPDTVHYHDISVIYGDDHYIDPSALYDMCFIEPGQRYSLENVNRTYSALSRLSILRFINIEMRPVGSSGNVELLDAVVNISRNRKQSIAVEVEGTNSEGDLGFGVGATYQNRNIGHGSELLTVKVRTSYESLSGDFTDLITDHFTEYAAEVGVTFPKFILPFASREWKRQRQASTEFALSFNYQERPEYTRVIAGGAWRWKWNNRGRGYNRRYVFDLLDINYVRLPESTIDFLDEIAPSNPLLRYSYEDHFIMRMGYTYYQTNRRIPTAEVNAFAMQPWVSTLRVSGEIAGNLLYGISSLFGQNKSDGVYKIFGIQYSQYVKGEVDYSFARNFDSRNSLAFHAGVGIAYPYGNSSMVPFEKRFYAGGANGVRGWGVRTLGPGCYNSQNSVTDFINQSGDISLILSLEYRAKLFWVLEGALFVDAGNIWTIRDYPNQPGGKFKFKDFYKQIAASYGIGLRMDFTYFLLRLDLGLKALNPAMNQERWPLLHPKWSRDANFHFSVGYPF